jgi:hypothetical protein
VIAMQPPSSSATDPSPTIDPNRRHRLDFWFLGRPASTYRAVFAKPDLAA